MKEEIGLGDMVENAIKVIAPKIAKKYKSCSSCKKRKSFLNKYGAKIYKFKNNKNANFS